MSLSIATNRQSSLANYMPVYNPIVYVVGSTNVLQDNFKYVCRFAVTGESGYKATVKASPRPDGSAVFDLSEMISNYLSHDINIESDPYGFHLNTNSFKRIIVYFWEEYGTPATEQNQITDTIGVINASLKVNDWPGYSDTGLRIRSDRSGDFLTNRPNRKMPSGRIPIMRDQNAWAYLTVGAHSYVQQMDILTYDSAGTLIATYEINQQNKVSASTINLHYYANVGTFNINQIDNANFISGMQTVITANVKYYTIKLKASGGYITDAQLDFEIVDNCSKYDNFRIHFLNELGGFDSFNFNMISRKNISIERKTFNKRLGGLDSNNEWTYGAIDRTKITHNTNWTERYNINSDWLTQDDMDWLKELFTSPVVFWEQDNQTLIPVTIAEQEFEIKKKNNEKVIQVNMTILVDRENKRQSY